EPSVPALRAAMKNMTLVFSIFILAACGAGDGGEPARAEAADDANDTRAAAAAAAASTDPKKETTTAETRAREAPQLEPAFAGQTRAPIPETTEEWTLETVAEGLEHPWAIEFLPDGAMLVSERPGRLRLVSPDGSLSDPIAGVPEVDNRNQGGLLDVAIAPDFESSRVIFLSFAEPHDDGTNNTALARARLSEDRSALEDVE